MGSYRSYRNNNTKFSSAQEARVGYGQCKKKGKFCCDLALSELWTAPSVCVSLSSHLKWQSFCLHLSLNLMRCDFTGLRCNRVRAAFPVPRFRGLRLYWHRSHLRENKRVQQKWFTKAQQWSHLPRAPGPCSLMQLPTVETAWARHHILNVGPGTMRLVVRMPNMHGQTMCRFKARVY